MEKIASGRGGVLLVHRGFVYRKDKVKGNTINWRCSVRDCKGRLVTPLLDLQPGPVEDDVEPVQKEEHLHAPNPARVEVKKLQETVKERALASQEPPRRIVQDAVAGIGEEAATQVRSNNNLTAMVNRKRRHGVAFPPAPHGRLAFAIPPNLRVTKNGHPFLLHDSGPDDADRLIIFAAAPRMLHLLRDYEEWFVDGTFKVSPEIFCQVYTVHVLVGGTTIPCLYALLPDKRKQTYERMWEVVVQSAPNVQPRSIMSDFEIGAHQAIGRVFPHASVKGCFFHLGQSLWRKIQEKGLREEYVSVEESRTKLKMLLALAFLPTNEVSRAFETLQEEAPDQIVPIFDFFEDTYIGRPQRRQRRQPMFPRPLWNMHERTVQGLPRTNNAVEAWHRAFQGSMTCQHPTLWRFIETLRREQSLQEATLAQAVAGGRPIPQRKKYEAVNRRLQRLLANRHEMPVKDFLRGCAHNCEINV